MYRARAAAPAALLATIFLTSCAEDDRLDPAGVSERVGSLDHRLTVRSEPFLITAQFDSMHGPAQTYALSFGVEEDEILWLRGVRNRAVVPSTQRVLSEEFLCHSNMALAGSPDRLRRVNERFVATASTDPRLFTLIQGRNDVTLPEGFGFPVAASEALIFDSMVINKNWTELPLELAVETAIDYRLDSELEERPRALFKRRIFTFLEVAGAALEGAASGPEASRGGHHHGEAHHGVAREGQQTATAGMASNLVGHDREGREYTFHWVVEPGRHEYRSEVSTQLLLPFATTLHYATAHLHPFGESVAIVDLDTGETVVHLGAREYDDRIGVAEMDELSSVEGVSFDPSHRYELVTVYDNRSDQPIDAMAIVYLYFHDRAFEVRV
jgi:hypothetical protein